MSRRSSRTNSPLEAVFALPVGFTVLLVVGAIAAGSGGRIGSDAVLAIVCAVVGVIAAGSEPIAAPALAVIGWLTAESFSGPPYGQVHTSRWFATAVIVSAVTLASVGAGVVGRALAERRANLIRSAALDESTIDSVVTIREFARGRVRWTGLDGIGRRRLLTGFAMAAGALPALTAVLVAIRPRLALDDDLLFYLAVVLAITLVGGFWPAVVAAAASSLLLNWFFTPPVHTWTIDAPHNLLALLLFVSVAVTVSSVVHLAARRAALAAELAAESNTMLSLARTVLAGDDTAQAVLDHLRATLGWPAELRERVGRGWSRIAGVPVDAESAVVVRPRADLELRVQADADGEINRRLLEAFAAQTAAALDRERLRTQAAQAEALAEGNRMRTALLAAVSHDLRTPLAAVKASVSTLRQTDIAWAPDDRDDLLATIEEGADRLNSLIGNLLDMSRVHTGALQPLVRPTALDEVAPVVAQSIDGGDRLDLQIPEDLPLLAADPGLLERALANLVSNALRYSPADRPPTLAASAIGSTIAIEVIDHGPGVPEENRELILQPFQQLGDQRFTTGAGVGLGLAVAKGFVEAMGGSLLPLTTPGGGLTMRVELPASATLPQGAGRTPL